MINVYAGGGKRQLQEVGHLLDRANQALQTLERYKVRLDDAITNLTAVEVEDIVSLRDVVAVVQRGEMVHRIADEIETMIIELGVDARLLRMQIDELYGEIDDELDLVVADYLPAGRTVADTLAGMSQLSDDEVLNLRLAADALAPGKDSTDLSQEAAPKGLRLLHRVSRLPAPTAAAVANHFGGLAKLQRATVRDLMSVEGVDEATRGRFATRSAASRNPRSSTSTADTARWRGQFGFNRRWSSWRRDQRPPAGSRPRPPGRRSRTPRARRR